MLRALIRLCVRRRVPVLVFTLAVAAYGVRAYLATPVEAFPDVTDPQVTVIAQLPGLVPEEIERQVTLPLERVLNGTPSLRLMRSESLFGLALIEMTFEDAADPFRARAVVNERVADAELPTGANVTLGPDATPFGEIYQFRVVSDRHTLTDTRGELQWTVSRVLRAVPGVADVVCFGGFLKEIHVQVDPSRLNAHNLSLSDVTDALGRSNRNVGGGFLRRGDQELTTRGVGYLTNASDVQEIVLAGHGNTPVRVGDVARVVASHTPTRGSVGYNLDTDVTEGVALLRRGENTSHVLDGIHEKVHELNDSILPKGMRIEPFYDRTTLVDSTLSTVRHNLLFGVLLVILVVWLFLRSLRCSLIVASVIPFALLTAFIGLRLIGLPANATSMGAIDVGILVGGAGVVAESVLHAIASRRPTDRRELLPAIARSALDVARPTFFAMAIAIAALIPVLMLERVEGRVFRPLALAWSFALAGALVFALTAVPALLAIALRPTDANTREPALISSLRARYTRAVAWLLQHRLVIVGSVMLLVAGTTLAASHLGTEFLSPLDEGDVAIFVQMPPSIALDKGTEILREVRRHILAFPEVINTLSEQGRPEDGTDNEGLNMSETFVRLLPREQWPSGWDKERLIEAMRASLVEIPGISYNFSQPIEDNVEEAANGVRGQAVLKMFGTDLTQMTATLERCVAVLKKVPGVVDLHLYREARVPQLQVVLDRPALARAGIMVGVAQDVVDTALSGRVVTELWQSERPVPIRVILPVGERDDESRIGDILVPAVDGARVPLREIAHIERTTGRASINRESNSRVQSLTFNVEGRDPGSAIAEAQALITREVSIPDGDSLRWEGDVENRKRAMSRLAVVVLLSALAVCGLLYTALGSLPSALTILAVTPFAVTGGVFALAATGIPLSVSAAVGFIALLGQSCLASLLLVSVVNERRRAGEAMTAALTGGAASRFRVVLMTATLAILGLMPAALSHGAGSETQRPFAVVMIGGLLTAVPITLFVLPVLYSFMVRRVPLRSSDNDIAWDGEEAPA